MLLLGCFILQKFNHNNKIDYTLFGIILLLLFVGLAMVYSSSHIWASFKYDDVLFFVKRQLFFACLGVVAMCIIMAIPYYTWKKYSNILLFFCFLLLIAVLIPGIGLTRGGAQSWIGIGVFSIQPSEFMKLGLIIFLAAFLSENQKYITTFKKGFLPTMLFVFIAFGFIMLQPDLGTGVVIVLTSVLMIFIAGGRIGHFMFLLIIGIIGFILLILSAPYRISRITAFLNPWEDPLGDGFQIIQSLYAIGPGGLLGVGFGNSLQKYFYLPEPQTDFIFSILSEEMGFIGGVITLFMFFILLWRGALIALRVTDGFGRFLAFGITAMLLIQVMINVSVVIGLIPVTGITLPFLSYGGSSLTLTLCSVGILLNISKYAKI